MSTTPIPFIGENGQYHFVYRVHNLINGKEYTGKHTTNNLDDGYYGSGIAITNAISKYGIDNFAIEILSFHNSSDEAFANESVIVDEDYIARSDTYNQVLGGIGNWRSKGMAVVKDKGGNTMRVSVDDPRYLSRELVGHTKGLFPAIDSNGNKLLANINDIRFKTGQLVGITKGQILVKDSNNQAMLVRNNDPKYISGELVGITKGMTMYKDKYGNTIQTTKDDPRVISGEFSHVTKGIKYSHINKRQQIKCPHCNKIGDSSNMHRWHFDNCKLNPLRQQQ